MLVVLEEREHRPKEPHALRIGQVGESLVAAEQADIERFCAVVDQLGERHPVGGNRLLRLGACRPGLLADLKSDEDQGGNDCGRANDLA
jgi:hypothetical protein